MVKLLPILLLITTFIFPAQTDVRYYRNEQDFLADVELPERKLGWWSYIEVHYDEQGRVERKLYFKRKGKIKQYQVMQYDSISSELTSRTLLNADSVITSIFTYGPRQERINDFLRYRVQIDSVQDEGDRFIETVLSRQGIPEEYRLYDVNGSQFGAITREYDEDGKLRQEDWLTVPGEDVIRRFHYNYTPEAGMTQILEYDSTLAQVNELWVLADGTTSLISVEYPRPYSSVSSLHLYYNLVEDLAEGTVIWEWVGGNEDTTAPYYVPLIQREMTEGYHEEIILAYTPELMEGAAYRITFEGTGVSGYPAVDVVIESVTIDTTKPQIFVRCDSVVNSPEVYVWASEALSQMEMLWYWLDESDSLHQHVGNIIGKGLQTLSDDTTLITVPVLLEDGQKYALRTTVWDLAGNPGIGDTITDIRYDITAPQFYSTSPKSGDYFNRRSVSYKLSERAASGELAWRWIGGAEDSIGSYIIPLSRSQLEQGVHSAVPANGPPPLVEDAVYEVTLGAEDFAGNSSDKISIVSVTYDTTAPVVEIMLPRPADAVKNAAVTYIASEQLSSAEISWSEVVFDTTTVIFQTETLTGEELTEGLHEYPGMPKGGRLRDGNTYLLTLSATDQAGNEAIPFEVTDVRFDTTGPVLADLQPDTGVYVQDARISYYVDEDVAQGVLLWKQIAGVYDPESPHRVLLEGEELKAGEHIDLLPVRGPKLHDGSVYELSFVAADRAGNSSNLLVSDSVHYDVSPPQLAISFPVRSNPIKSSDVEFTVNEKVEELKLNWIWSSGSLDTNAPHILSLAEEYRHPDSHLFADSDSQITLKEGAFYDIVLTGQDLAGNEGMSEIIVNLLYDTEAPVITWSYPGSGDYITGTQVSYSLSEFLEEGKIVWEWEGGREDPLAPHKALLTIDERSTGEHINLMLQDTPLLVDGAIYSIQITGSDAAGNNSNPIEIEGVRLDMTPPEIVVTSPLSYTAISSAALDYSLSEELAEGSVSWIWSSGIPDPEKIHRIKLNEGAMEPGEHLEESLSAEISLVDGAVYSLIVSGRDFAGNEAPAIYVTDLYYDATPPVITDVSLGADSHVNHSRVAYTLSENVSEGSITWQHAGGTPDELAPHLAHLLGRELNAGVHPDNVLEESPLLNDGSMYSISIAVQDAAGNDAETIVIDSVRFDVTNPEVAILSPEGASWIFSALVEYELSENLVSGRFIWEWIGGSDDPLAPHSVTLMGNELLSGIHEDAAVNNLPQLVEGAFYDLTLEGEDFAGNPSMPVTVSALGFDATNPVISDLMPTAGSFVNHSDVSYTISENLTEAKVTWIEKGPGDKEISRQEAVLTEAEREAGSHLSIALIESPELKDGSVYDIIFGGDDAAGNKAEPVIIEDVTYDVSPPELALQYPESDSYVRSEEIAYSVSEQLTSAQVVWTQIKGITDTASPQVTKLSGDELLTGQHPLFNPADSLSLVDGAVYSIELIGKDIAGNESASVKISNVHYDAALPVISGFSPESWTHVNHTLIRYELSENVMSGQVVWERTGGSDDPETPHEAGLAGDELLAGVHPGKELSSPPELVDGSTYNITITARDSAGNVARPVVVSDVLYDVTPPLITAASPADGAFLLSASLTYELSETCAFGKAVWRWTGGTEDSAGIHDQSMITSELAGGSHDGSLEAAVELIDGAIYQLEINCQDLAGNESEPVIISSLYYDATPPELAITAPSSSDIVNHTRVSYTLTENLQSAVMEWEAAGGEPDMSAPHLVELIGDELSDGDYNDIQLAAMPSLNDGTVYSISFHGIDKAGNVSDTVRVEEVLFDISPPELTITNPVAGDFINSNIVSYTISEPLSNGRVIWTESGEEDEPAVHEVPLVMEELTEGDHTEIKLMRAPRLSDGGVYDISIFGMDLAGNPSDTLTIANLTFDNMPPRITIADPVSGISRNTATISYSLSEDLALGTVSWTRTSGAEDTASPHLVDLSTEELKKRDYPETLFADIPVLQDGAVYTIKMKGEDPAGNVSVPIVISDIKYDVTPPELEILLPLTEAAINSSLINYTLSEPLEEAQIRWKWSSGIPDFASPHVIPLKGNNLDSRDHIGIGTRGILVSGVKYNLELTGTDKAGNEGEPSIVKYILFDTVPPHIAVSVPSSGMFLKDKMVSYTLSEDLAEGKFLWEQKSGTNDPNAPHEVSLVGEELAMGEHDSVTVQNTPSLVEGAIYDVTFTGSDAAANRAEEIFIPVVGFDSKPPVIAVTSPSEGSRINEWVFDYSFSEDLLDAEVYWQWVGGPEDPGAPHTIILSAVEKSAGDHAAIIFAATPFLVDGTVYRVTFSGRDRAENQAGSVTIGNLTFDVTPPAIVANRPAPMTTINNDTVSFSLSETLESGKIVWTPVPRFSERASSVSFGLTGEFLQEGLHDNVSTESLLQSGVTYSVSFEGRDLAGNKASGTIAENVTFDNTLPILTILSPQVESFVNEARISYSCDEDLSEGELVFVQTGGTNDPDSPHRIPLSDVQLKRGEHLDFNPAPPPDLVNGAIYQISMIGADYGGNRASSEVISNVEFDTVAPEITISSPSAGEFINSLMVGYVLSESLTGGKVILERISGTLDPDSPHEIRLPEESITAGEHSNVSLTNQSNLVDGAIYSLRITGFDAASNQSYSEIIENLTFDISKPIISQVLPISGIYVNSANVSYTSSEPLAYMAITWEHTGGEPDPASPYTVELESEHLTAGRHDSLVMWESVPLKSGSVYSLIMKAADLAGNEADLVSMNNIAYDVDPPVLSLDAPAPFSFVNNARISYSQSEELAEATLTWTSSDGSSTAANLTASELSAGSHKDMELINAPELSDGETYELTFAGVDMSGNISEKIMVTEVVYDVTQPTVLLTGPEPHTVLDERTISFRFSEDMSKADVIWSREAGVVDPASPHRLSVQGDELTAGDHDNIEIPGSEYIQVGTIYSVSIEGEDLAGNKSRRETIQGLDIIRDLTGEWLYKGALLTAVWRFSEDGDFVQGVMMGTQISNEQPGRFDVDFSTKPFEMTILYDDGVKRFALFEFLGNNRMRVVTSQVKPKSWSDGDLMEFEFNPVAAP